MDNGWKVGDRFIVNKARPGYAEYGEYGTITKVDGDGVPKVTLDSGKVTYLKVERLKHLDKRVFYHTAHRDFWNHLAVTGSTNKATWSGWRSNGGEYDVGMHYCMACEYANNLCSECPLIWPGAGCKEGGSLYDRWCKASFINRQILAAQIRDLPVKLNIRTV